MFFLSFVVFASCSNKKVEGANDQGAQAQDLAIATDEAAMAQEVRPDFSSPTIEDKDLKIEGLPEDLVWYTSEPGILGSSRAKQGGTARIALSEYPQTFRTVGPNSNGSFRSYLGPSAGLIAINPETKEWMPQLATHWAFGADGKTVYYKLNENVKFNDGEPVSSDDYVFTIEMMTSEHIQAPWYNDYYGNKIEAVKAYGDYVVSVTLPIEKQPDELLSETSIAPRPRHFYSEGIKEDWVDTQQWVYEPTVGPYRMSSFEKGESVTFEKVPDWWGYDYDYNTYRYNVDKVNFNVITGGLDIQKQHFYKGEFDTFALIIPKEWADSADEESIINGYIDRHYSFFVPLTGLSGIVMNTQKGIFQDQNVRTGMYYAINMDKMIATVLRGEYSRYHNIGLAHVFAGVDFDDESIRKPGFDPDKAGEYFDKAGFSSFDDDGIRMNQNGERLSFELLYSYPHHTERLSVLKEEAKKAGLDMELNNMTEGSFAVLLDKKHEAFFITMSTGIQPSYWQYYHSENAKEQTNNFFMIDNAELDKLIMAFREESNMLQKAEISKKIQRKVDELALVVPDYTVPYVRYASWKWIRFPAWLNTKFSSRFANALDSIMSDYNGYMWIDEEIKEEVIQAQLKGETFESRTYIDDRYKPVD